MSLQHSILVGDPDVVIQLETVSARSMSKYKCDEPAGRVTGSSAYINEVTS